MIKRARENVLAIKDMHRSGNSLVHSNTPGGTSALMRGAGVESGLSLKTKLNSEFEHRSSVIMASRDQRNKIMMTPNALQNLIVDNVIDSQEINVNFGYSKR